MGFKANSSPSTRPTPRYQHLRPNAPPQTPSPSWRANFKQSCLERARRNRDSHIKAKRQSARELIEEELEESGVMIGESRKRKEPEEFLSEEDYFISEYDLYELMQEVEEELQRDGTWYAPRDDFVLEPTAELMRPLTLNAEERLVEELEQLERYEEQFRNLIADYDDWEEPMDSDVLCPVCKEANLMLEDSVITCPNYMSGYCALHIEAPSETLTLMGLRDQLAVAFGDHAGSCPGSLDVHVRRSLSVQDNEYAPLSLVAQCYMCETNTVIL